MMFQKQHNYQTADKKQLELFAVPDRTTISETKNSYKVTIM